MRKSTIITAVALLGAFAFRPMLQAGRLPAETAPLPLTDAVTGQAIPSCLVVPRYTGPGDKMAVMRPFIYKLGQKFAPFQPNATGDYFSNDLTFDGITVIAPGYRTRWISSLWGPRDAQYFKLIPLNREEGIKELQLVNSYFTKKVFEESYAPDQPLRWSTTVPIHNRFDESEKQWVKEYIDREIASLAPSAPDR